MAVVERRELGRPKHVSQYNLYIICFSLQPIQVLYQHQPMMMMIHWRSNQEMYDDKLHQSRIYLIRAIDPRPSDVGLIILDQSGVTSIIRP
jgi:hypothetical protein